MSGNIRLITRIALFSAMIYVLSWGTTFLPNVNLAFFITFLSGYLWGAVPGLLVGMIGMGLWTSFNPYGPATFPVMLAQVVGMGACGLIGHIFKRMRLGSLSQPHKLIMLTVAAIVCSLVFYLPVTAVDAWVYQPFWPRFYTGLAWGMVSLLANLMIFPLLFVAVRRLYDREN